MAGAPNFLRVIDAYEQGSERARRSRLQQLDEQSRSLTGAALSGDQNALKELGGVDPNAYMNVSKFTTEQKAQRLDQIASGAFAADTPQKWEAFKQTWKAQGHTLDPSEEPFTARQTIIDQAMGWKEKLAQSNADRSYNLQKTQGDRSYDLQNRELTETKRYHDQQISGSKAPAGYRMKPDGSMEFIPGGPADPNKPVPTRAMRPTNDQSNAAGFYDRMSASNKIIAGLERQGTNYWQNFARDYAPGNTAAYFMTPEFQQYDQAQRDFINAQLRKESGAAISQGEFDNARRQYFPQPGDSDAVIKQKAQNRQIAIDAMHRSGAVALEPQQARQPAEGQQGQLQPGAVEDGYVFLGGDPSDQNNWQEAR